MKRRISRKRRSTRRSKKNRRSFSRGKVTSRKVTSGRVYRGGANLPVPEGSVVGVDLDPKDDYSVPVLVSKSTYEDEILED